MSKHHQTANQDNPSQPSAVNSTVIEGEVIADHIEESIDDKIARGRAYSKSKSAQAAEGFAASDLVGDAPGAVDSTESWFDKYRVYVLWALMFTVVILVLFATRPNTAWQVQHINTLQSDVAQLYEDNQVLEARLTAQEGVIQQTIESALAKALSEPENQPLVSQADLEGLKQSTQQQLMQLQAHLLTLKEGFTRQVEKAKEAQKVVGLSLEQGADQLAESVNKIAEAVQPSDVTTEKLKLLEQKLQTQMGEIGTQLTELFDSSAKQTALTPQQPLDGLQIQQWIVAINTQWMLQGRVAQTKQQLLALEQAIGLSDLANLSHSARATTLARLIGQDLANLEALQNSAQENSGHTSQGLRRALKGLKFNPKQAEDGHNKPVNETVEGSGARISVGQEISSDSAWDQLLERFGQMVSLKKRDASTEQSKVESLIMQDVLLQRAWLLVDRIDWAMQTQSTSGLNLAIADLEGFVALHFSAQAAQITTLLQPFKAQIFELRQPLAILNLPADL